MASDDGMSDVLEISSDENASTHERREGDTGVVAPGEPEAEEEPEGETDPYSCYDVTTGHFSYDTHGTLAAPDAEDDECIEPVQEDAVTGAEDDELAEPVQEDAAPGAEDDELAVPVQEDAAPGAEDDELAEPVQEDPSTEYFDYDTPGAFATPGAEEEEFAVPVEEDPYGQTADEFVGLEVDPYSLPAEDGFPAENCDSLAEHEAEAAAEVEAVGGVAEEVAEESQQKVGGDTRVDQAAQDRASRPGDSSDTAEYEDEVDWGDGDAEDEQAECQGPQSAAKGPQPKKMPCAPKAAPCRANAARSFNLVSGHALKGGIAAVLSGAPSGESFTAFPQPLAKTAPGASQQPDGEGSTASYLARKPIFIPSAAAKATRTANQQANGLRGAAKGTIVEDLASKPGGGVPTAAPQPPTKAAPAASQQPDRLRGVIKGSTAAGAPGGSVPTAAPQPPSKPAPPASQQPDRLRGAIKGGTAASAPGGSSSAKAPQPSAKMAPAANQQPDRLRGTIKGSTAEGAPGGKEPMAAPQPSSKSARAVDQRPDREVWRPSAPRRSAPQQPSHPPPQHLMRQQPRQPPNKAAPVLKPGHRNVAVLPSQAQPTQAAKKRPAFGYSDPQASSDAPALAPAARLGKQPRPSPVETSAQVSSAAPAISAAKHGKQPRPPPGAASTQASLVARISSAVPAHSAAAARSKAELLAKAAAGISRLQKRRAADLIEASRSKRARLDPDQGTLDDESRKEREEEREEKQEDRIERAREERRQRERQDSFFSQHPGTRADWSGSWSEVCQRMRRSAAYCGLNDHYLCLGCKSRFGGNSADTAAQLMLNHLRRKAGNEKHPDRASVDKWHEQMKQHIHSREAEMEIPAGRPPAEMEDSSRDRGFQQKWRWLDEDSSREEAGVPRSGPTNGKALQTPSPCLRSSGAVRNPSSKAWFLPRGADGGPSCADSAAGGGGGADSGAGSVPGGGAGSSGHAEGEEEDKDGAPPQSADRPWIKGSYFLPPARSNFLSPPGRTNSAGPARNLVDQGQAATQLPATADKAQRWPNRGPPWANARQGRPNSAEPARTESAPSPAGADEDTRAEPSVEASQLPCPSAGPSPQQRKEQSIVFKAMHARPSAKQPQPGLEVPRPARADWQQAKVGGQRVLAPKATAVPTPRQGGALAEPAPKPSEAAVDGAKPSTPSAATFDPRTQDHLGREFRLTEVVVNFANVAHSFSHHVLHGRGFEYEGVRRCVRYFTGLGMLVTGVVMENANACDNGIPTRTVPPDIRQMCAISEAPRIDDSAHSSADDEITIRSAYNRNCFLLDNDNYRDWQKALDTDVKSWYLRCKDKLHLRYYFDGGQGSFELLLGNKDSLFLRGKAILKQREEQPRQEQEQAQAAAAPSASQTPAPSFATPSAPTPAPQIKPMARRT